MLLCFLNIKHHNAEHLKSESFTTIVYLVDQILIFNISRIDTSRITNKWMRLGVPLVGCGDLSEAAHENL